MTWRVKFAIALAVCLFVVDAIPTQFPRNRTLIYSYYGDIKAGIIEPAEYASQYAISGKFYIKPDTSDPSLPNAFIAAFRNVSTGLHNGLAAHYQPTETHIPVPEAAKIIEDPFLIAYDSNGKFQGVKLPPNEAGWSKNIKLAVASMFQLDLPNMKLDLPIEPQAFLSEENTIHGDCWNSYEIHAKNQNSSDSNEFTVIKFGSPTRCTNYQVSVFNHVDDEGCQIPREKPVNMASRRVFQAEKNGETILIKSLVAHGGVNYFPWNYRSEAHYILNNASFVLEGSTNPDVPFPVSVNFIELPLITDVSFQRPRSNYADKAGVDITQGRHSVEQNDLILEVKEMLIGAADYLKEDHLNVTEPDFKHGHTINRILTTMGFMKVSSFVQLYNDVNVTTTAADVVIRNLFLAMIPQVGTHASSIFMKDLIVEKAIDAAIAVEMLIKFPLNVRNPTTDLLIELEPIFMVPNTTNSSYSVRATRSIQKAAILSFASLTFRTFKNTPELVNNKLLNKYLHYFDDLFKNGDYEMKMVALMAMRNIQVGRVFESVAPIIRGKMFTPGKNSTHLRLLAIWAIEKSIPNYQAAHDLLWPIMADYNAPLKLRIAAYDILVRHTPSMENILHLYWFMVYEKNEHLYNYHYTTINGLANSADPCNMQLKETTTKIMRFTRIHSPVPFKLSASYMADAVDKVYGHGESYSMAYTLNERTGHREVLNLVQTVTEGRKRNTNWKMQFIMDGDNSVVVDILDKFLLDPSSVTMKDIQRIIVKAARGLFDKSISTDIIISYRGRVILAEHYEDSQIFNDLRMLLGFYKEMVERNRQIVQYDALYEEQVISEIGLPIVLESRIPVVTSIESRMTTPSKTRQSIDMELRIWRHGDYSMSIYNPFLDLWHTIRRSTATDVIFPVELNVEYLSQENSLKIVQPIAQAKRYPKQGIVIHAKDCITVTEEKNRTLEQYCPSCNYTETVSNGPTAKKKYESIHDVKDTGFQYTNSIFDCENGLTPVLIRKYFSRAFFKEPKNAWYDALLSVYFASNQQVKNILISPRMGSCGILHKKEPSLKYPTTEVELTLTISTEDTDKKGSHLHYLNGERTTVGISYEAKPSSLWNITIYNTMSPGHENNTLQIRAIRSSQYKRNLQICIDAKSLYPSPPSDPLDVEISKVETNSELTFSMAEADNEECSRNGSFITVTVQGTLSEEQEKQFAEENTSGACAADRNNSLYSSPENFIPKTSNCVDRAIRYATPRKYTINATYANLPEPIASYLMTYEDVIKTLFLANVEHTTKHTEGGKMRIGVEFPMQLNSVDVSVAAPGRSYDIIDAEISENDGTGLERDPPRLEGFGPDPNKHLWMSPLDNTHFSTTFLNLYTHGQLKMCSVYPKILWTLNGRNIPYVVPNIWTLASGDKANKIYDIFVKNVADKMSLKISAGNETVEISPDGTGFSFKINDEGIDSNAVMANGTYVPQNEDTDWIFKITTQGSHIWVKLKNIYVIVIYTSSSLTIGARDVLQGSITGLCQDMSGKF